MEAAQTISLVIPAHNEAERLPRTLDQYLPALQSLRVPYEVIVISDGTDQTPAVARAYSSQGVRCNEYPRKLGRGGAVLEGFRSSSCSIVAYADADGSVPPGDLTKILQRALAGARAVIASRRLDPDIVVVPETALRRYIGTAWHLLVRLLLGLRVKDAQCGLKAFSRSVVTQIILPRVRVTNRTFEVGMLYHVQAAGVELEEIPVKYVHDFRTRMPILRAMPVMFLTLLGIFLVNVVLTDRKAAPTLLVELNTRFDAT